MQNREQMESFVFSLLKDKIPASFTYHNSEHTAYVMDKVMEIGTHENCSLEELDLLKTAALWHDSGYIHVYNQHEEEGCSLAKKYLPDFGYTQPEIDLICDLIMATKVPQQPKNKLETILADADLEYLGTENAFKIGEQLFSELQHLNSNLTREKWNEIQIGFLQNHHYFTNYCKLVKEPVKEAFLNNLLKHHASV